MGIEIKTISAARWVMSLGCTGTERFQLAKMLGFREASNPDGVMYYSRFFVHPTDGSALLLLCDLGDLADWTPADGPD